MRIQTNVPETDGVAQASLIRQIQRVMPTSMAYPDIRHRMTTGTLEHDAAPLSQARERHEKAAQAGSWLPRESSLWR